MLKFLDRLLSLDVSRHIQRFIFLLCLAFAGVASANVIITFPTKVLFQCFSIALVVMAAFVMNGEPPLKVWECALLAFFLAGSCSDAYDDGFMRSLRDVVSSLLFCAFIHGIRRSVMPQEGPQISACHSDEAPGER